MKTKEICSVLVVYMQTAEQIMIPRPVQPLVESLPRAEGSYLPGVAYSLAVRMVHLAARAFDVRTNWRVVVRLHRHNAASRHHKGWA